MPNRRRSDSRFHLSLLRLAAASAMTLGILAACQGMSTHTSSAPGPWQPDVGNGTFKNPVLNADYSDPDVLRVGNDYYLTASSFSDVPGLPILHSKDLVNWTIIGHVFDQYPLPGFDKPQHGNGVWAPSLRFHNGLFYVYFGDPDNGIFMATAKNPAGPWSPLHMVKQSKGWIDTCPFWDNDGNAYLVHAWANSRAGVKDMLTICKMAPDGKSLLDDGVLVVDGRNGKWPTVEGPKLYKRNGWYYILAPAGGVTGGYQVAYRSKTIQGTYEGRIVMDKGNTPVNGPHQGGWVTTQTGEDWFMHFQDKGPYGRVVHLQPMKWVNDWPVIGEDPDGDGKGQPVLTYKKPNVGKTFPKAEPQTSDDFSSKTLGLQWQWPANPQDSFYSLAARPGWMRLNAVGLPAGGKNLWDAPNLLLQKLPADEFTFSTMIDISGLGRGGRAGIVIMGQDYAAIYLHFPRDVANGDAPLTITCSTDTDAINGKAEVRNASARVGDRLFRLTVHVAPGGICTFEYQEGTDPAAPRHALGAPFHARMGRWIGAKIGLFAGVDSNRSVISSISDGPAAAPGHVDFDNVTFTTP
jgi:beta-xylosidase